VAAIMAILRMISASLPGNARPRMSMSRVIRRAPNWASSIALAVGALSEVRFGAPFERGPNSDNID
jgi:hypothetical protein